MIGLDSGKYTLLIAAAFAAVIAARLRSLPVAVIVGLLMGIAGSLVQYFLPPDSEVTANIIPSIPFAFVVISLIVNIIRSAAGSTRRRASAARSTARSRPNGGSPAGGVVRQREPLSRSSTSGFPIVLFAGICLLPLDLQALLAGR